MIHTISTNIIGNILFVSLMCAIFFGSAVTLRTNTVYMDQMAHGMGDSTCPMTPSEHADWWSAFFAASSIPKAPLSPLLLFVIPFVAFLWIRKIVSYSPLALCRSHSRDMRPPPIKELFSDGLLHPRVYA